MNLFLECATITDSVDFLSKVDKTRLNPIENSQLQEMAAIRKQTKTYSDMEFLIGRVQKGDNLITKKVIFDKYLKANVDTMRIMVQQNIQCPFSYNSVYGSQPINTQNMSVKEQWAVQMIMFRYIVSSIYQLGSFSAFAQIFTSTKESYNPKFQDLASFSQHLSVATSYLREAYEPLQRLNGVFTWLEKLMTPKSQQFLETKQEVFYCHRLIMEVNIGYLMLEKLRLLGEFRKCKEGAKNIVDKLHQVKQTLSMFPGVKQPILEFITTGLLFFKAYSLVFFLKQNQNKKSEQDYGFVKKEFKSMIVENLEVAKQVILLCKQLASKDYKAEFYDFASDVANVVFVKYAQDCQYVYSVKTQNAADQYKQVQTRTFEHIWETIPTYDLANDI